MKKVQTRDVTIWLAGLISSDGCVFSKRYSRTKTCHGGRSTRIKITSSEKDWLEHIQKILKTVGIESRIYAYNSDKSKLSGGQIYRLQLSQPKKIYELLKKEAQIFIMPRKF
jgi:intein/homing endonuclease